MRSPWGSVAALVIATAGAWTIGGCGSSQGPVVAAAEPELRDGGDGDAPDARAAAASACPAGGCPPHCGPGRLSCEGRCTDPRTDSAHCGGCGQACTGAQVCARGACRPLCGDACGDD